MDQLNDKPVFGYWFFNNRYLHYKAIEIGNRLIDSPSVELVQVDKELFFQGWQYFKDH